MKLKSLFLAAMAALALVACNKNDSPEIILPDVANALLPGIGGFQNVFLDCKGGWVITTLKDSWISVSPSSGTGSATVKFSAEKNTTGKLRKEYVNINEQQFLVVQTVDIEIGNIVGVWETKAKDFIFTFREDKTCTAAMSRGNYDGTYKVVGNIIEIAVTGKPTKISVVVNEISDKIMKGSVSGTELELTKQ